MNKASSNTIAYEEIELYGLTENGTAQLPMPSDEVLRDGIIREAFDALLGPMLFTGLEVEVEPLAHGLASLFFRRKKLLNNSLDKITSQIKNLIYVSDGSEVLTTQLEKLQTDANHISELLDAVEQLAESAAQCYEAQTQKAFIPAGSSRLLPTAHLTGAVYQAKEWIEAQDKKERDKFPPIIEGRALLIAGQTEWTNYRQIWDLLDKIKSRFKDTYAQDLVIYHKGYYKGVDQICAAWAVNNGVKQIIFKPNWNAFNKAAGFKAIDLMFETNLVVGGALVLGASGVAKNLGQKAEKRDIRVMEVDEEPPTSN